MRKIYAKGLFVHKDKLGENCCIGDKVSIKCTGIRRDECAPFTDPNTTKIHTGQLRLRKTVGIVLIEDDGRVFTNIKHTGRANSRWEWTLLSKAPNREIIIR